MQDCVYNNDKLLITLISILNSLMKASEIFQTVKTGQYEFSMLYDVPLLIHMIIIMFVGS